MASRFEQPGEFDRPTGVPAEDPHGHRPRQQPRQPGGGTKKLKYVAGFVALVIAAGFVLWGDRLGESQPEIDPTPWRGDIQSASVESKATGKPALYYFTANWCVPCKEMRKSVFPDDRVQALLRENFVLVRVDLTRPDQTMDEFQKKWEVRDLPTFVALRPDGSEIDRAVGLMHRDGMLSWLETTAAIAKRGSVQAR